MYRQAVRGTTLAVAWIAVSAPIFSQEEGDGPRLQPYSVAQAQAEATVSAGSDSRAERSVLVRRTSPESNAREVPPSAPAKASPGTLPGSEAEPSTTTRPAPLRTSGRPSLADRLQAVQEGQLLPLESGSDAVPVSGAMTAPGEPNPGEPNPGEPREFAADDSEAVPVTEGQPIGSARLAQRSPDAEPNGPEQAGAADGFQPRKLPSRSKSGAGSSAGDGTSAPPSGGFTSRRSAAVREGSSSEWTPARGSAPAAKTGVVLSSQGPVLQVETHGPRAIRIGQESEYRVTLSNHGDVGSGEVHVRVLVPEWVQVAGVQGLSGESRTHSDEKGGTRIQWTVDNVPSRGAHELVLRLIPRQSRAFELAVDWTFRPAAAAAQIEVQQPQLEITLYGPQDVLYGETAVYTIAIANPGTGDADDVVVSISPGGAAESKPIGTIPAGEQHELKVELVARQAGAMTISASAAAPGGLHAEAAQDIVVRRAALEIDVEGPPVQFAGSTTTYQVRLANVGNAIANETDVTLRLPAGAKYVSGLEGAKPIPGGLQWRVSNLAPAAERTFEVVCELLTAGDNSIEAVARGAGLDASGNFVTRVEAIADLKLTVADPQGPQRVGEDVVYQIHITNRGTKAAEKVQILAQFSEGIEPLQATGQTAEIVPGQVVFRPVERVEAGQEIMVKVVARADRAGSHRFRAEITCDDQDTKLVSEDSTRFVGDEYLRVGARPGGRSVK